MFRTRFACSLRMVVLYHHSNGDRQAVSFYGAQPLLRRKDKTRLVTALCYHIPEKRLSDVGDLHGWRSHKSRDAVSTGACVSIWTELALVGIILIM